MRICDYCLGLAEMDGDPEYCECHALAQVEKKFKVTFRLVGEDAPDLGMGAGVIGYQEFSLFADSDEEAGSDIFYLAVLEQAEKLQENFIRGEVEEL